MTLDKMSLRKLDSCTPPNSIRSSIPPPHVFFGFDRVQCQCGLESLTIFLIDHIKVLPSGVEEFDMLMVIYLGFKGVGVAFGGD